MTLADMPLSANLLPSSPPITTSQVHDDATTIKNSVQTLISLLFTSSAFRLLLTDVFITTRQIAADFVSSVGDAAQVVASGANVVEGVVRPSEQEQEQAQQTNSEGKDDHEEVKSYADAAKEAPPPSPPSTDEIRKQQAEIKVEAEKEILDTVNESKDKAQQAWTNVQTESPDRIKETIINRIKAVSRHPIPSYPLIP